MPEPRHGIRDVLGLSKDPPGDGKRTARSETCRRTTAYWPEIGWARPRASFIFNRSRAAASFLPPPTAAPFFIGPAVAEIALAFFIQ